MNHRLKIQTLIQEKPNREMHTGIKKAEQPKHAAQLNPKSSPSYQAQGRHRQSDTQKYQCPSTGRSRDEFNWIST